VAVGDLTPVWRELPWHEAVSPVNERLAGTCRMRLDAADLPGSVCFSSLMAGDIVDAEEVSLLG